MTLTVDQAIARLKPKYELVYVAYDDRIADHEIQAVLDYDLDALEHIDEWASDQRWDNAHYAFNEEFDQDEREELGEFVGEVIEAIIDRDEADYYSQLIRQTPNPLLRVPAYEEDLFAIYNNISAAEVLEVLNFPQTKKNLQLIDETLANCGRSAAPYWVMSADLKTLWDIPLENLVRVTNPHLFLGHPYSGTGWVTDEALEGSCTIKRSEFKTDKAASGYSVMTIFGGGLNVSSFACEVENLNVKEAIAELRAIEEKLR